MKTYSKEHIEQLLTRFMEGTSTLEEEDLLARYFKEEKHLPEAWKAYREMFAMFDAERDKINTSSMPKRKRLLPWYWTVAAAITLLAVVGVRLWNHEDEEVPLAVQKTETVEKIQVETEPVVRKVNVDGTKVLVGAQEDVAILEAQSFCLGVELHAMGHVLRLDVRLSPCV